MQYKLVSQFPWETEKYSGLDAGFIWVKPDSILIYRCHLFDVWSIKFPALPNLVRKEKYLNRENAGSISRIKII